MNYAHFGCQCGIQNGDLFYQGNRCLYYSDWDILEHFELTDENYANNASEPQTCMIPIAETEVNDFSMPKISNAFSNFPNPFNPTTTFKFFVPRDGYVSIEIFSVDGKLIDRVINEFMTKGKKTILWNCNSIPSGLYFVRMKLPNGEISSRKIVINK